MGKVNYEPSGKTQGYVAPANAKGSLKIMSHTQEQVNPSIINGAYKQENPKSF